MNDAIVTPIAWAISVPFVIGWLIEPAVLVPVVLLGLLMSVGVVWVRRAQPVASSPGPRAVITVPDVPALPGFDMKPLPVGREIFTRQLLPAGRPFAVVVEGVLQAQSRLGHHGLFVADACYHARQSDFFNFRRPIAQVYLDDVQVSPISEDRYLHRYVFAYTGTGRRLSVRFKPFYELEELQVSTLRVGIGRPTEEILRREEAQRRSEEMKRHRDKEGARRAAQKVDQERAAKIAELAGRLRFMTMFENDRFVSDYGRAHPELVADRNQILTACADFHRDPELVRELEEHYPEIYRRATWLFRAYNHAEAAALKKTQQSRRAPQPPQPKPPAPLPQPPTPEDMRQHRAAAQRERARDRIHESVTAVESALEAQGALADVLAGVPESDIADILHGVAPSLIKELLGGARKPGDHDDTRR